MKTSAICAHHLSIHFKRFVALDDISFEVPEGAFVAIIGPNGAGKSTFLKTLLGLLTPTKGEVQLFGQAPQPLPHLSIGYVPQVKTLDRSFPARVLDLVVSGLRQRWPWRISKHEFSQALTVLEQVGIAALAYRPLSSLSEGQLQRAYLARSLARQPRILLLDEPASGIDYSGEVELYGVLHQLQKEQSTTILMITHDWDIALKQTRHVLLLNHRIIGFGPPHEVLRDELLYKAFGTMCPIHSIHREEQHHA